MDDQVLPFYLVCDEATLGSAEIRALNDSLRRLHADARFSPRVSEKTMLSLIGFSDTARVVLPLTAMSSFAVMPRLKANVRGSVSWEAAFAFLREVITRDAARLIASNRELSSPAVFFLAGPMPAGDKTLGPSASASPLGPAYQRLTDASWPWHPTILTFGNAVSRQSLQQVATIRAFSLDGSLDPERALREMVQALGDSISASSRAQSGDGSALFVTPERVTGFDTLLPSAAAFTLSAPSVARVSRSAPAPQVPGSQGTLTAATERIIAAPAQRLAPGSAPSAGAQGGTGKPAAPPVAQSSGRAAVPARTAADNPGRAEPAFPEVPALGRQAPAARSPLNGLPVDRHRVPDTVLDGADLKGLAVRGASLRGDAHRDKGLTRQDAMGIYSVTAGGIEAVLGCVASGKDGESLSHLGAEQACLLLRDEVAARLPILFGADPDSDVRAVCQDIAERVAARLAQRAGFLNAPPHTLSTTLAAAVVEAGGTARRRRCVVFRVGDCAGLLIDNGRLVPCFTGPRDGGEPGALPDRVGQVAALVRNLPKGTALVLYAAGLSRSLRQPEVRDQFLAWWTAEPVPSLPEFAWQLSFRARSCDDDRTAICIWAR